VKHSSCGDLTSLQWSVGHGIEPVDALVLKEIAIFRIQPVVRLGDSEGSHDPGMRARELVILRHSVIAFKQKILAEDEPLARATRSGGEFSNYWGEITRTRICMLGTLLCRPRDPSVSEDAGNSRYPPSSVWKTTGGGTTVRARWAQRAAPDPRCRYSPGRAGTVGTGLSSTPNKPAADSSTD
jgi:hypothetical protein